VSNPPLPPNPFSQGEPPRPPGEEPQGHFSARVPEKVRGVYCTAQVIHDSPKEFIIDFMQGLTRPFQVVARVVMTPATMAELIAAYEKNVEAYSKQFGAPTPPPVPPQDRKPTIEEIYEHYKIADDMQSGVYANTVLMGHSPTEFFFDFITTFYPTPSVSARVILPAPQGPRFLSTLKGSLQQFQQRYMKPPDAPPSSPPPPPSSSPPLSNP
jgi:hypothetical protein